MKCLQKSYFEIPKDALRHTLISACNAFSFPTGAGSSSHSRAHVKELRLKKRRVTSMKQHIKTQRQIAEDLIEIGDDPDHPVTSDSNLSSQSTSQQLSADNSFHYSRHFSFNLLITMFLLLLKITIIL